MKDQPENRLQLVLDNLPVLVAFLDRELCYEFANHLHFTWFGADPSVIRGQHVRDIIGAEAHAVLAPHYDEALAGQSATFMGEVPYASGGKRFIHGTAVPLSAGGNGIEGIVALAMDLTDYKLMERALDATTLRSKTVLDTAVDGIVTIDEHGIIQSCNASLQKLFGYTAKELVGNNVRMLMPSPYAENHDGYLQRYLETGEKRIIGIGREVTGKRKDGSEFPLELAVGEFIENGQHFFTGFTRDITDRRKAEQEARAHLNELAHVTRLSTIHNLASGIAHEINQPLTAIVTMAQALLRTQRAGRDDPEMLESTLEKIVRQSVRASNIIQQMREFIGKKKEGEKLPHDIDAIISNVLQLVEHEIERNNIRVHTQFDCGGTPVQVNRIQIEQVVMNLVQNAIEAMADINRDRFLTIKTRRHRDNSPFVEVMIADTGPGLPEKTEHIFEPFFSTKSGGMGQGLSISRSIIETHGGTIKADPNHDHGAVFTFTLTLDPVDP